MSHEYDLLLEKEDFTTVNGRLLLKDEFTRHFFEHTDMLLQEEAVHAFFASLPYYVDYATEWNYRSQHVKVLAHLLPDFSGLEDPLVFFVEKCPATSEYESTCIPANVSARADLRLRVLDELVPVHVHEEEDARNPNNPPLLSCHWHLRLDDTYILKYLHSYFSSE